MIKAKLQSIRLSRSLRAKLLYVSLLGLALGALIFFALSRVGLSAVNTLYMSDENVSRRKARIYMDFSSYVSANNVTGRDVAAVARWTATHDYVTIYLFGTGREQQLYGGGEVQPGSAHPSYDPTLHGKLYPIRFADGLYQIAIDDNSQLRQRQLVYAGAFFVACLCFLILHTWYTGRLARRIIDLSHEAAKVSAGDLDRSIAAKGADEIGALAASMDEMRRAVIERMGNETRAWQANAELITAVSHDIRTPMTSLIGYLGLLCDSDFADTDSSRQFAASAYGKAMELKDLTDQLFRYFLVYGQKELALNRERLDARSLLEQLLGEAEFDLNDAGFTVRRIDFKGDCVLDVDPLYLKRVLDNLVSNVKKYSDPAQPVVMLSEHTADTLSLTVSNAVSQNRERKESTKIGLRTCEKILTAMGGSFTTHADPEHFAAELTLPTVPSA
ncbi:MAG: HAMP domain-containing histidine kinase [Oscillospiraceae bacterium]|nr:HAMP domain-containing histidine kinase [Oscillospiraceae bacterium]